MLLSFNESPSERFAFLVEYNGTRFSGSQLQAHRSFSIRTIQETLHQACQQIGLRLRRSSHLSARTDAGVHSLGQVAMLDVMPSRYSGKPDALRYALNSVLPRDMAISAVAEQVDPAFHALHSCKTRWYQYRIDCSLVRPVFLPPRTLWYPRLLSAEALAQTADLLKGAHEFTSFKCPNTGVTNDVCWVVSSTWRQVSDAHWVFDIVANRFLYQMVRILVGSMLEVADVKKPSWSLERFSSLLTAPVKCRSQAGSTAPAEGLTLMAIAYEPPFQYFYNTPWVRALHDHLIQGVSLL